MRNMINIYSVYSYALGVSMCLFVIQITTAKTWSCQNIRYSGMQVHTHISTHNYSYGRCFVAPSDSSLFFHLMSMTMLAPALVGYGLLYKKSWVNWMQCVSINISAHLPISVNTWWTFVPTRALVSKYNKLNSLAYEFASSIETSRYFFSVSILLPTNAIVKCGLAWRSSSCTQAWARVNDDYLDVQWNNHLLNA